MLDQTWNMHGWALPGLALTIVLLAVTYSLVRNWFRRRKAESELLKLCNGDSEMLERLIAFEQDRTPGQGRAEAAKAASYAIRRDRR